MHGSRQFRSTSTSPIFPVNSQEGPVTSSGMIHRSRSLNLCPALTTDNDGPMTTDRSQRPGSAAASPRTQSPALLHIVGLEIGRQRWADHGPQPASRLCRGLSADPESRAAPHRGPRDRPRRQVRSHVHVFHLRRRPTTDAAAERDRRSSQGAGLETPLGFGCRGDCRFIAVELADWWTSGRCVVSRI